MDLGQLPVISSQHSVYSNFSWEGYARFSSKKRCDSLKRATFCSSRSKRADEKKAMQKVKWGKVLKRPHRQFDVSGLLSNFIKYKNIEKKIVKRND